MATRQAIRLRDAVLEVANDKAAAAQWAANCQGNFFEQQREAFVDAYLSNRPAHEAWNEILGATNFIEAGDLNRRFTAEALGRLRSGTWIAEGFRTGEIVPHRPPPSWWNGDVDLVVWDGTVVGNGVTLHNLVIHEPTPEQPQGPPLSKTSEARRDQAEPHGLNTRQKKPAASRPPQDRVNKWLAAYALTSGEKLLRDPAIAACRTATHATYRQAFEAFAKLDPKHRFGRGKRSLAK